MCFDCGAGVRRSLFISLLEMHRIAPEEHQGDEVISLRKHGLIFCASDFLENRERDEAKP
jgi:hypothetical protein